MINTQVSDILATVQTYLDGLYEGDTAKLRKSFHASAYLKSVTDDKVSALTLDDWLALVEKRVSPISQGFTRQHERILAIEIVAPNFASVVLNCAAPGRLFKDQLTLLKSEGRWQIVNKVFDTQALA